MSAEVPQRTIRQARAAISEAEQVQLETMSLLKEPDPEKTGWSQFKRAVFDGSPLSKRRLKSFSKILGMTPRNLLTVAELYNPERFAQPAKKLGLLPGEAYDLQLGDDLLESGTRDQARSYFQTVRPGLVVISPPCTLFSRLQQLSKWKTHDPESMNQYLRRLRQAKVLLHFGLEIAQIVMDYNGIFVFEHPLTSEAWQLPKMQKFMQQDDVQLARGDQCMYGLVDYYGKKLQKPTGWMTNSIAVVQRLSLKCDRQHTHTHILGSDPGGSRSAQAQHYPKELVTAILLGYRDHLRRPDLEVHWTRDRQLQDQERHYDQFYLNALMTEAEEHQHGDGEETSHSVDKEQEFEDSVQIDEEVKALPRERPFSVEQLVRKAHESMGHPGNDRLVRILKAAKASPEAIKIARELHCSVCHQHQHTRTPRPSAPPKELTLNSVVGVDTLYLPSWDGRHRAALNVVDWASRFQMIIPLSGPNPAAARQAYLRWVRFFGPPSVLKVDLGREFIGAFELGAELDATVIEPSSLEMPTQRSITERAGRSFKEVFSRTLMHHAVENEQDWLNLVDITSMTVNRLMNKSGYSPIQRVLGYTPRLPGGLLTGGREDLSSTSRFLIGDVQMQRACQMRLAAAKAFHEADCSQALSNALHAGRRKTTNFQVGQVVYFWRKATDGVKKNAPRFWRGPARVVLTNPPTAVWCTFNGNLVKAAPEQVRAASPEEMFAVSEWMDGLSAARESLEKIPKRGFIDITDEDRPPPEEPPPEDLRPEDGVIPKYPIRSKTSQGSITSREEDIWEQTEGGLRRLHRVPRQDLFHPADQAERRPVPLNILKNLRRTRMVNQRGEVRIFEDDWTDILAEADIPWPGTLWTGYTDFFMEDKTALEDSMIGAPGASQHATPLIEGTGGILTVPTVPTETEAPMTTTEIAEHNNSGATLPETPEVVEEIASEDEEMPTVERGRIRSHSDDREESPNKKMRTEYLDVYSMVLDKVMAQKQKKEIRLRELQGERREKFITAIQKENNLNTGAYEIMSPEDSEAARRDHPEKILQSRYVLVEKGIEIDDIEKASQEGILYPILVRRVRRPKHDTS